MAGESHLLNCLLESMLLMQAQLNVLQTGLFMTRILLLLQWDLFNVCPTTTGSDAEPTGTATSSS